jgi:hypothetical protein
MSQRIYWFTVVGKGNFPFAMLHLSQCWPSNAENAEKITLACPTVAPEQRINLASHKKPTTTDYQLWSTKNWPIAGGGEIGSS